LDFAVECNRPPSWKASGCKSMLMRSKSMLMQKQIDVDAKQIDVNAKQS
jgi:hypothetical protein